MMIFGNSKGVYCALVIGMLMAIALHPTLASGNETSKGKAKVSQKNLERTMKFPDISIGGLYVIPIANSGLLYGETEASVAKGVVKLQVPPGSEILLRGNSNLLQKPNLLDSLAPDCIDCLEVKGAFFDLDDEQFANKLLLRVSKLTGLNKLRVSALEPDDAGMSLLRSLKKLTLLSVTVGRIQGSCLKDLQTLPLLNDLDISDNPIKIENLKYIGSFPSLRHLGLHRCKIDDDGVKSISKCSTLEDINFSANFGVKDSGLKYLAETKSLQILNLLETHVTAHGLTQLKSLPHLRLVSVSPSFSPSPQGLAEVQKNLPHVKFSIQGSSQALSKETARIFAPMPK